MTTLASAVLPLPPGINASYKSGKGKFYGSPELVSFKDEAYYALRACGGLVWPLIHEVQASKKKIPLAVSIVFYFPTLWKRDIDGGEKAAIDAVFNYIGLNDNLIVDKHTRKMVDRSNPRCEIAVSIYNALEALA
jgi:Holliday junction resolvase RusA-like endonuclease